MEHRRVSCKHSISVRRFVFPTNILPLNNVLKRSDNSSSALLGNELKFWKIIDTPFMQSKCSFFAPPYGGQIRWHQHHTKWMHWRFEFSRRKSSWSCKTRLIKRRFLQFREYLLNLNRFENDPICHEIRQYIVEDLLIQTLDQFFVRQRVVVFHDDIQKFNFVS